MSHDSTSRKVFGVTHRTIQARILATWNRATPSQIEAGARWYDESGALASTLAGRHGLTVEQSASVISALSPRTTWARNVAGAVALLERGPSAARALGCIGVNVERARRAKVDGYAALTGPKISAFARNIAGDRETVTVDVWACRVASLDENLLGRVGAYDAVAAAYVAVARKVGVDPATLQATTWIVARNGRAA